MRFGVTRINLHGKYDNPFLKALGAHTWDLSGVTLATQRAYARQVQSRRPVKTREIKPARQWIELVCFLRVTLLELTDVALLQWSRRSQQLFREAAERAKASRIRGTTTLLKQAAQAGAVLHDEMKTWQDRVLQAGVVVLFLQRGALPSKDSLWNKHL